MKALFVLVTSILVISCNPSGLRNENGVVFDSDKITGKYELSLLDIAQQVLKDDTINTEGNAFVYGLASLVKFNISFYENHKGSMASTFRSEPELFEYKVESDSILYVKSDSVGFKKIGVIHKFTDNYDFISIRSDSFKYVLNLKKTGE